MAFAFFKSAPHRRGKPTQSFIGAGVGVERGPLPSGMCGSQTPLALPAPLALGPPGALGLGNRWRQIPDPRARRGGGEHAD